MIRWILAAVGVLVLSVVVSTVSMHRAQTPRPFDPQAYEANRQILLRYEQVPLARLLANPEQYDGRKVRVAGFMSLDFEEAGLHPNKASYDAWLTEDAVWLDKPEWLAAMDVRRLTRRYAEVAGTFHASESGHMSAYSGALTDLKRISPILTRSDIEAWLLRERYAALNQTLLSGRVLTLVGWLALGVLWLGTRRW